MRERERPSKPSRPSVDGAEKPKTRSSSKSSSSKSVSSKPSSSSTSAPKKATTSTSKSSTSSSKSSSSSRTKPTGVSSSSSKARSSLELKPEKLPLSTSVSKDKEGRRTSERLGSRDLSKSSRSSVRKDDKTPNPASREPRGDRTSSRKTEKVSTTSSRNDKSSSRSKGDRVSDTGRGRDREEKSSRSQSKSKDVTSTSRSEKRELVSSRRGVGSKDSSSRSSKDSSSKVKSSDKGRSEKSSRGDNERIKESRRSNKEEIERRSSKEEKNRTNESKSRTKDDGSRHKSSRSREKSAKSVSSRPEKIETEQKEDRDSGIEALGIQSSIISSNSKGHELEGVEHNENSLETMESGISLSSPRDLSGDEGEVEESISSKMVEIDESISSKMREVEEVEEGIEDDDDDVMMEDGGNPDAFIDKEFMSGSNDLNSMDMSAPLSFHQNGISKEEQNEEEDDYDYEEDFEDYESDFEDDSGSGDEEDEENDDESSSSSSSTMSSSSSEESDDEDVTRDPNMSAVLQAMEKENNFDNLLEKVYSFDDATQDERPVSPQEIERQEIMREVRGSKKAHSDKKSSSNERPKTSRAFVNFAGAKKKQEAAHISSKMNSRGRALLSMIQLDTVSIDLLTMSPVSYETYISSFGHSNRQQISVQTNEDALSEEIQTDEIVMRNKWTQKPVHITFGKDGQMPSPEDYIGVGGDMDPVSFADVSTGKSSTTHLSTFLSSASQVMLALLEEELVWETAESNRPNSASVTTEGLGFSQPPTTLGNSVQSLLEGRNTFFVQFCQTEPSMILSGHGFLPLVDLQEEDDEEKEIDNCGLLCVWGVQEPSRPQQLLSCCSSPTSASFSPGRPSLVVAGLEDGSLAAWDLRESLQLHTLRIDIDGDKWRVRVPSYVTACEEGYEGEGSAIVAIHTVTTDQDLESESHGSFQVVTLSSNGRVSWWVVMHVPLSSATGDIHVGRKSATSRVNNNNVAVSPHLGSSPWARIVINRAATIDVVNTLYGDEAISNEISCNDLKIDGNDLSQLYVATGSGAVAHLSRHATRIHPKAYLPEIEPGCEALCMDLCPHDHRYLLVGSSDGLVRLHSIISERPLTSWQSSPDCAPIKGLQWSPARPCVFYVMDDRARLHIWDLSAGDIFPVMTVEAGGLVGGSMCSFNIAPTQATSRHPLFAVFASDGGEMVLRQVGPEFGTHQLQDDYDTELERFTYYVNII